MTVDELLGEVHSFAANYFDLFDLHDEDAVDVEMAEIKSAIEQYGKEEREKMRKECLVACRKVENFISTPVGWKMAGKEDYVAAIEAIK